MFDTKINDCTKSKAGKIGIILVSLIWFAVAISLTAKLEPLSEMEEFIDPDHELMKVFTKIGTEFPRPAARKPTLTYIWGASELDRTETNFFNTTFKGDIVWDEDFSKNFHKTENQAFALATCKTLREDTKHVYLNVQNVQYCNPDFSLPLPAPVVVDSTISCWAMDFEEFITNNPLTTVTSAEGITPVTTEPVVGSNVFPITDKLMFYKQLINWISKDKKGIKQFGSDFGIKFTSLIKNPDFESNYV